MCVCFQCLLTSYFAYCSKCFRYYFLYLMVCAEGVSMSRLQANLGRLSGSIIREAINSFYSYSTSLYWDGGLNLCFLIRAICLQWWHEKFGVKNLRTSCKKHNELEKASYPLSSVFLPPSILESNTSHRALNGQRKMMSVPSCPCSVPCRKTSL